MRSKNAKNGTGRAATPHDKVKDLPGFPKLTPKQVAMQTLQNLPDDCDWDDVEYTLALRRKVEQAFDDIRAGRVHDHDEVFRDLEQ